MRPPLDTLPLGEAVTVQYSMSTGTCCFKSVAGRPKSSQESPRACKSVPSTCPQHAGSDSGAEARNYYSMRSTSRLFRVAASRSRSALVKVAPPLMQSATSLGSP